jgi:hemerythrin-like domain-containing protein
MGTAAAKALTKIVEQHEALRALMDRCEDLADELDLGRGSVETLVQEVVRLRVMLEEHTRSEEHELWPFLVPPISDHVQEHRALRDRLASGPTAELRATVAMLRDHLAGEERYFSQFRVA